MEKILQKRGFYTIYEKKINNVTTYRVDNGKTLFVARFNKIISNPYRDIKEFKTLESAKNYIDRKLKKSKKKSLVTVAKSNKFFWNLNGKSINYDFKKRPRRQEER